MEHIAILRKGPIFNQIISKSKTIESRWYVNRIAPYNKIFSDDTVYFKISGGEVKARAKVQKVIQYDNLNEKLILEIIKEYGKEIAPDSSEKELLKWAKSLTKKNYCILIFLKEVEIITPFNIDKTGFGVSCAWMTLPNVNKIKII
jgi:hypothetical protein